MKVCRSFSFDAAHYLPGYDGKCSSMHGHRWILQVEYEGPIGSNGMVVDFSTVKAVVESAVICQLDHTLLNKVIEVPTAENLLVWIATQLKKFELLQGDVSEISLGTASLTRLRLYESPDSFAEMRLPGMQVAYACDEG